MGPFKSISGVLDPYRGLWRTPKPYFGIINYYWNFEWFSLNSFEWIVLLNILYSIEWIFWILFWIESFLGPIQWKNEFSKRIANGYAVVWLETLLKLLLETKPKVGRGVWLDKRICLHQLFKLSSQCKKVYGKEICSFFFTFLLHEPWTKWKLRKSPKILVWTYLTPLLIN